MTLENVPAPLPIHQETVRPEWIDYNGHMNVAFYVLAFDHAADAFFDYFGLTEAYREAHNVSTFAMETHITYLNELRAGDKMRFEIQMLDLDHKRIHYFNRMYSDSGGGLAATAEWISTHMDMTERKTAPFHDDILANLQAILDAHKNLPKPEQAGHVIGIRRR
jgi:acyl-CoA thioester hydrolase